MLRVAKQIYVYHTLFWHFYIHTASTALYPTKKSDFLLTKHFILL